MRVKIRRLPHAEGLPLPSYESAGAAGADVVAAIDAPMTLAPLGRALVPTGLCLEIPAGHEIQVRPRSGLAARQGVTILNAPGTIDADYRGEVKIVLVNLGPEPFTLARGDRIAQLVLAPVLRAAFEPAETLEPSVRGEGGFGSTGVGARS